MELTLGPSTRSFNATVIDVHDGDAISVSVNLGMATRRVPQYLGFSTWVEADPMNASGCSVVTRIKIRLVGINAPELATIDGSGVAAQMYLDHLLVSRKALIVPPGGRWALRPGEVRQDGSATYVRALRAPQGSG